MGRTLDRSASVKYDPSQRHWVEVFRDAIYQMKDEQIVELLSTYRVEADRLRYCMRQVIESNENQEDDENNAGQT